MPALQLPTTDYRPTRLLQSTRSGRPILGFRQQTAIVSRTMPPDGRDLDIIARINGGDTAAVDELYQRHRRGVFRLAMSRLGDRDEALDVVQDTFLKLFALFPGFELTSAMTTFLHPLVHNLCRDRRVRWRVMVDIDELDDSHERLQVEAASIGGAAAMLAQLTEEQREILALRFGEDLSLPQVAEALGTPIGTIKSRMHRAIAALRDNVGPSLRRRA